MGRQEDPSTKLTALLMQDGVMIEPEHASSTPVVRVRGGEEGALYTLIASDPDPPDPANPTKKEWLHWLVTNIPGGGGDVSKGHEVRQGPRQLAAALTAFYRACVAWPGLAWPAHRCR